MLPIPVAARSKTCVCVLSLAGIAGSNPTAGHGCLPRVNVVCFQVEFSASGRSLFQKIPTECGVSEHDHEVYRMRRSWPTRGCCALKEAVVLWPRTTRVGTVGIWGILQVACVVFLSHSGPVIAVGYSSYIAVIIRVTLFCKIITSQSLWHPITVTTLETHYTLDILLSR
jgi:hypothetical protein